MSHRLKGLLLLVTAGLVACGGPTSKSPKKQQGSFGQDCYPNGTCNTGLVCVGGVCDREPENNSTTNNATANNTTPPDNNTTSNNQNSTVPQLCGNGVLEPGEVCDGTQLNGATCASRGYDAGTLACNATCTQFDESACTRQTQTCGNGTIDAGEVCDGNLLAGQTCGTRGFDGGTLRCGTDCTSYDTAACTRDLCGNGVVDPGEVCDGNALNGATCANRGYDGGTLACEPGCTSFDESACRLCGNGVTEPGEVCDRGSLNGATCQSRGYVGGTLACNGECTQFDESNCTGELNTACEIATTPTSGMCSVNDPVGCYCAGCVDDGVCEDSNTGQLDDCVCADCQGDPSCITLFPPSDNCNDNGKCDPLVETCSCADCSNHQECMD